jgi:hypothetical protein
MEIDGFGGRYFVAEFDSGGFEGQIGGSHQKPRGKGGQKRRRGAFQSEPIQQVLPQRFIDLHEDDVGEEHLRDGNFETFEGSTPTDPRAAATGECLIVCVEGRVLECGYWGQLSGKNCTLSLATSTGLVTNVLMTEEIDDPNKIYPLLREIS